MGFLEQIGTIAELWRYPVKSMRGESVGEVLLDPHGLAGDRRSAFTSTAAPAGKPLLSGAERTAMLRCVPRLEPTPAVMAGDGRSLPLESPELLAALTESLAATGSTLQLMRSPDLPLTDVRPVSLVSTATLRGLGVELGRPVDGQRFRSNLVLALRDDRPFAEDRLSGQTLCFGDAVEAPALHILERIPRCRMVSIDPRTNEADPEILRHLARHHEGRLGIYARVLRPGQLRAGQAIFLA